VIHPNGLISIYKLERMFKEKDYWRVYVYNKDDENLIEVDSLVNLYTYLAKGYSIAYDFVGNWNEYNEDKSDNMVFSWKLKNYGLSIHTNDNNTLDAELVKYENNKPDSECTPTCFVLAYWNRTKEGYELKFVLDRPFEDIDQEDVGNIWQTMKTCQIILNDHWKSEN